MLLQRLKPTDLSSSLKRSMLLIPLLLAAVTANTATAAPLNVFACEPEWASLVTELGGSKVKSFSATTALQDPHHVEARPSLIAKARRADLVVCTGADLEVGWLPLLLRQSGNKRIQRDQPGFFLAAELVERLEIPVKVDRSMGDIHALGNPHVFLDPLRLLQIAEQLSQRLSVIDAKNQSFYEDKFSEFSQRWNAAIQAWEDKALPLKGKQVFIQHRNWSYLFEWLGIEEVGDLEPKPGLPPTSSHLAKLLIKSKQAEADFIIIAQFQNPKGAKWLAKRSNMPLVALPFTVGGDAKSVDLFSLMDQTLDKLLAISTEIR